MTDSAVVRNELNVKLTENILWGLTLMVLGIIGFGVMVFMPSASYINLAVLGALSLASIGAGIGKLSDANDIQRIILTMRR